MVTYAFLTLQNNSDQQLYGDSRNTISVVLNQNLECIIIQSSISVYVANSLKFTIGRSAEGSVRSQSVQAI